MNKPSSQLRNYSRILQWQTIIWILAGFGVIFVYLFIQPVFLNPARQMQFFPYVPTVTPIGLDLQIVLRYTESWLSTGQVPYAIAKQFLLSSNWDHVVLVIAPGKP